MPDPRDPRGVRYPLVSVLAVAVCATLAGALTFAAIADWLDDLDDTGRRQLGFTGGVPAASTLWRLLTRLDADLLATILARWLRKRANPTGAQHGHTSRDPMVVIAIDGKTMRGARRADGRQVHLLSALDTNTGIVLAQVTVEAVSGHGKVPVGGREGSPLTDR